MDRNKVELFWEHPGRYIFLLFLAVAVFCTFMTFLPKWFKAVCIIFVVVCVIKKNMKKGQKNK